MSIVYKTTNKVNGKIYIGKSKNNDPLYLGSGLVLKSAIEKYGIESFDKQIIEECSDDILDQREIYWINQYKSFERHIGYNIALGGTGGDTTSHHPDKSNIIKKRRDKLSEWHKSMNAEEKAIYNKKISESKKGKSNGRIGYKHSPDSIIKIKNNQPPKTEEWRENHAASMANRRGQSLTKKYKKIIIDGVLYESVKSALQALNIKYSTTFYKMIKNGKIKVDYI